MHLTAAVPSGAKVTIYDNGVKLPEQTNIATATLNDPCVLAIKGKSDFYIT